MLNFDTTAIPPGIYTLRGVEQEVGLGWAFWARHIDAAESIAQSLSPQPEPHFRWVLEPSPTRKRRNVEFRTVGGVALFSALPATAPGKAEGLRYFLNLWHGAMIAPVPLCAPGFVLALENKRGLVQFLTSKTPFAPGTVLRPGTASQLKVKACIWHQDCHLMLNCLTDALHHQGRLEGTGGWFRLSALDVLGLNQTAVMAVAQSKKRSA